MSVSSLFSISKDALLTQQMAMNTTSANIANVNTPGYARQRPVIKSTGGIDPASASTQLGIAVTKIERMYDRYVEAQIISQNQNGKYSDELLRGMQNIETLLGQTSGGLGDRLNKFWAAWDNLSSNPGGLVERSDLLTAAQFLTASINDANNGLQNIKADMNRNITDVVSMINDKAAEISHLNMQIFSADSDRGGSNSLIDRRDEALKELAGLTQISWIEDSRGMLAVFFPNGALLVQGTETRAVRVELDADGNSQLYAGDGTDPINDTLSKGKLGAYVALQDMIIPQYRDYINKFAESLAVNVNEIHRRGFDLNKNTGADFFNIKDINKAAGTISINADIVSDTGRIAASSTVSGNGENASKIAAIQHELLMNGKTSTLNGYLSTMVGQIGRQTANARAECERQEVVLNQLYNQRESISGVSIDEEMINLIKYQMAYTAAGKMCVTANELLDTLMGMLK